MKSGPGLDVPPEMRDMLEKGVSQAREGFGKLMQAADDATRQMERKADAAQDKAMAFHRQTMNFTESNVSAAFDLAANLVKAKSVEEVMKLQTEYMTRQFAALRGQIQQAGLQIQTEAQSAAAEMASETQKMQSRAKEAVEKGVAMARDAADTATKAADAVKSRRKT